MTAGLFQLYALNDLANEIKRHLVVASPAVIVGADRPDLPERGMVARVITFLHLDLLLAVHRPIDAFRHAIA